MNLPTGVLRRISVMNATKYTIRVCADSERMVEKTVNRSRSASTNNRARNIRFRQHQRNQNVINNRTGDTSSDILRQTDDEFADGMAEEIRNSSETMDAASRSAANANQFANSEANATVTDTTRKTATSESQSSGSSQGQSTAASAEMSASGYGVSAAGKVSASHSTNSDQNQATANSSAQENNDRNEDSNSTSASGGTSDNSANAHQKLNIQNSGHKTDKNQSGRNQNTDHRKQTNKSGQMNDGSYQRGNTNNNEDSKQNQASEETSYTAELEYRFIQAGYAMIEPGQTVQLFTKGTLAFVTISALIPNKYTGEVVEYFVWKNHKTIEEKLEIDMNLNSGRPQVHNTLAHSGDKYINALYRLSLARFIPAFKHNGWTRIDFWGAINEEDLDGMEFQKGHKMIFRDYVDKLRSGFKLEWAQFQEKIESTMAQKNAEHNEIVQGLTKKIERIQATHKETVQELNRKRDVALANQANEFQSKINTVNKKLQTSEEQQTAKLIARCDRIRADMDVNKKSQSEAHEQLEAKMTVATNDSQQKRNTLKNELTQNIRELDVAKDELRAELQVMKVTPNPIAVYRTTTKKDNNVRWDTMEMKPRLDGMLQYKDSAEQKHIQFNIPGVYRVYYRWCVPKNMGESSRWAHLYLNGSVVEYAANYGNMNTVGSMMTILQIKQNDYIHCHCERLNDATPNATYYALIIERLGDAINEDENQN